MTEIDEIYTELGSRTDRPNLKTIPKIIRHLTNIQQARVMQAMPDSAANIAKKLGLDLKTVEDDIQDLFNKGLVVPTKHGWNMPPSWGAIKDMIGSASNKYIDEGLQGLIREHYAEEETRLINRYSKDSSTFFMPQNMRVVPKWRTIKDIPGILPCEDTREIFKKSPQIVIIQCPCKIFADRTEECKEKVPLESCIVGLAVGRYELKRGTGRVLSYDECMELLDRLDQLQIVNLVANNSLIPYGVCNCHPCCCLGFVRHRFNKKHFNLSNIAKSRFIAETNPTKCTACRKCVDERCPVDAITMKFYPEYNGERACINEDECIGCGLCVLTCPSNAKKMKVVRPPEYIPNPASRESLSEFIDM